MTACPLRIGLSGIGLDTYWPQFAGLRARLEGYIARVPRKLQRPSVEIVNLGMIDHPERAAEAGCAFRRADVNVMFLHVMTYVLSSTALPVVQRAKVPVIVLNFGPELAIDYGRRQSVHPHRGMIGTLVFDIARHFPRRLMEVPPVELVLSASGEDRFLRGIPPQT